MKKVRGLGWLVAAATFVGPMVAGAADLAGRVEVSPFVGGYIFDPETDLENDPVLGARVGVWLSENLSAELVGSAVSTELEGTDRDARMTQIHLDALYHFAQGSKFRPFLAAGFGAADFRRQGVDQNDKDFLVNYGLGAKYFVNEWLAVRFDLRQPVTFDDTRFDWMYSFGLSFVPTAPVVPVAAAAPAAVPAPAPAPVVAPPPAPVPAPAPPPAPKAEAPPPAALEPAPEKLAPAPAPATRMVELRMERVHFDFDKYALRPEARVILEKNADYLKKNPTARVRIEGHCDERGTVEYNLALGERRAKAAFQYVADLGIAPSRMDTVSFGEEVPLDPAHNEEAWAKNRRAEFVELAK